MRKKTMLTVLIAAFAALIAIGATAAYTKQSQVSDFDTALTVNGVPVAAGEFRMHLSFVHVAKTYSYFKEKYGVDAGKDFWTTSYGGEIPIRYAREKTLQDEVRIKIQQILMKENGIAGDISYEGFLKSLKEENEKRQDAVKKGQAIYGPEQYGANEYFDYQLANYVYKLKQKLFSGKSAASEEELRKKYESDKETYYRLPDYVKLEKITIPFGSGTADRESAEQLITKAKRMIDSGRAFGEVAKQFNRDGKAEEQIFDETTAKNDDYLVPELKAVAGSMEPGQISGLIETKDEFVIVKCTDKKTNRYQSYTDVLDKVKTAYMDEQYEQLINKLVGEAHVQINQPVYEKIYP